MLGSCCLRKDSFEAAHQVEVEVVYLQRSVGEKKLKSIYTPQIASRMNDALTSKIELVNDAGRGS